MTNIKSKVIIGLVIFAIIIIGLQISFHLRIKDVKIFEMKANITDKGTGFNNNESVLDFGIVPKLSNSIKFIDISQTILDEAKVKIKLSGRLAKYVSVSESSFLLGNETKQISFTLNVPKNIKTGAYEGKVKLIFIK